jgi:hypothetical protein
MSSNPQSTIIQRKTKTGIEDSSTNNNNNNSLSSLPSPTSTPSNNTDTTIDLNETTTKRKNAGITSGGGGVTNGILSSSNTLNLNTNNNSNTSGGGSTGSSSNNINSNSNMDGGSNGGGSGSGGGGGNSVDMDARANRVAMNLAKLDATASLLPRTPLQWKGYAWRTFDQVRGALMSRGRVSSKSHGLDSHNGDVENGMGNNNNDSKLGNDVGRSGPELLSNGNNNNNNGRNGNGSGGGGVTIIPSLLSMKDDNSLGNKLTGGTDNANNNSSGILKSRALQFKQWATNGVKRRSCKVISLLIIMFLIVGVCLVLGFSAWFGWVFAQDPCVVSKQRINYLAMHPRVSRAQPDFVPVVPKIIHQQWKTTEIPEGKYTLWRSKFKKLFSESEFTYMLWTDENARELIKSDYPYFLEAYDGYEFGIQRADAARYFVLHKYGGLYADLDYEPLVNFWDHVPKDRVALVESPYQYNEKAQNSLMSSPIGDPFWLETFQLLQERKDKPVLQATGPMFLDALMKRATESFYLFPCENFQRLPLHLSKEEEASPFMSQLHRELLGRLAPMKYCGDYHQPESCQYAKHHNTASYLADTGVLKLLWTR